MLQKRIRIDCNASDSKEASRIAPALSTPHRAAASGPDDAYTEPIICEGHEDRFKRVLIFNTFAKIG
jgi:hypothetical protein